MTDPGIVVIALVVGGVIVWVWSTSLAAVAFFPRRELARPIRRVAAIRPQGGPAEVWTGAAVIQLVLVLLIPAALVVRLAQGANSASEGAILVLGVLVILAWTLALLIIVTRSPDRTDG